MSGAFFATASSSCVSSVDLLFGFSVNLVTRPDRRRIFCGWILSFSDIWLLQSEGMTYGLFTQLA
jgi:hypothetical protein